MPQGRHILINNVISGNVTIIVEPPLLTQPYDLLFYHRLLILRPSGSGVNDLFYEGFLKIMKYPAKWPKTMEALLPKCLRYQRLKSCTYKQHSRMGTCDLVMYVKVIDKLYNPQSCCGENKIPGCVPVIL